MDRQKRAERRRAYYDKFRADPNQFLQVFDLLHMKNSAQGRELRKKKKKREEEKGEKRERKKEKGEKKSEKRGKGKKKLY